MKLYKGTRHFNICRTRRFHTHKKEAGYTLNLETPQQFAVSKSMATTSEEAIIAQSLFMENQLAEGLKQQDCSILIIKSIDKSLSPNLPGEVRNKVASSWPNDQGLALKKMKEFGNSLRLCCKPQNFLLFMLYSMSNLLITKKLYTITNMLC